jgi:ferrochelatase
MRFDALLLLSFGGPEGPEDVRPFLRRVLRGRPVAPQRLEQIAAHYMHFGGRSPINDHNRALLQALEVELARQGRSLALYWGNRNWAPLITDAVSRMADDGVRRAAVFVTSAYSSYSGCRQYLDDLEEARLATGPGAPELLKLRPYFDHPGFVEPLADGLRAALVDAGVASPVLMSAHSIPTSMAAACDYEQQLRETAGRVAARAGLAPGQWQLVFQSRSGRPDQPWLGPDVHPALATVASTTGAVVVAPIGFVSDHMEVVYDLDTEASAVARDLGLRLVRAATPGTDPRFVRMVLQLVDEMEEPDPAARPRPCPCARGCLRAR